MSKRSITLFSTLAAVLVLSLVATAQMPHYGRGAGAQANCPQPGIDLANKVSLEGTVESVNMGPGQGFPSFILVLSDGKKATILSSPYRALMNANYSIRANDRMSVLAYPSLQVNDTYVAAELKNLTTGTVLTLRDENGLPVVGTHGGSGMCGLCPHANPGGF